MTATPYFELHIRPMFRVLDRDHMLWKLDLWKYDDVVKHADTIKTTLLRPAPRGMPTKATGGPWPAGWVAVFELWQSKGFPRLALTTGQYMLQRQADGRLILSADIPVANGADNAWLDREVTEPTIAEYTVWRRPETNAREPATIIKHRESVLGDRVAQVYVHDANGRTTVADYVLADGLDPFGRPSRTLMISRRLDQSSP